MKVGENLGENAYKNAQEEPLAISSVKYRDLFNHKQPRHRGPLCVSLSQCGDFSDVSSVSIFRAARWNIMCLRLLNGLSSAYLNESWFQRFVTERGGDAQLTGSVCYVTDFHKKSNVCMCACLHRIFTGRNYEKKQFFEAAINCRKKATKNSLLV